MTTPYVTAADVIASMPLSTAPDPDADPGTEDAERVARITSLLEPTAEMIDAEIAGLNFHRYPAAADDDPVTRTVDGLGSRTLHAHLGILSLTSIETRYALSSDWEVIDNDPIAYELESMFEDESPDRPYDHVRLTSRLPRNARGVRLTGHFGWSTPPARLKEANVAWIRQILAAGDSYSGAMQVPEGQFIPTPRLVLPDTIRMFLTREAGRYRECYT
jgi:hypothetical protein